MQFTKMHGIGNDYVYINGFEYPVDDPARLAIAIADRHFGVGGDGMVLILPPDDKAADIRMRMFNADGSESEMCGNAIRCVCKYAHDNNLCTENPMKIQTGAGLLTLEYTADEKGQVDTVTVNMGEPILDTPDIPVNLVGRVRIINESLAGLVEWPRQIGVSWIENAGVDLRMTSVSMGNPHAVIYCTNVDQVPLQFIGPILETLPIFPNKMNIHFVQVVSDEELIMRTWERGTGITLACGTGASAVGVAGVLTGNSAKKTLIHLPGGDLNIEWRESDNHVYMTGPATYVFTGDWPENAV